MILGQHWWLWVVILGSWITLSCALGPLVGMWLGHVSAREEELWSRRPGAVK